MHILKLIIGVILIFQIFPFIGMVLELSDEGSWTDGYKAGWIVNLFLLTVIMFVLLLMWCFH